MTLDQLRALDDHGELLVERARQFRQLAEDLATRNPRFHNSDHCRDCEQLIQFGHAPNCLGERARQLIGVKGGGV
jgi:hypothetical protein